MFLQTFDQTSEHCQNISIAGRVDSSGVKTQYMSIKLKTNSFLDSRKKEKILQDKF